MTKKILEYDTMIKEGHGYVVQKILLNISFKDIPRKEKYEYASLARRVNIPFWSLKLLNSIVRSEKPIHPPPSEKEIINYAAGLIRVGNISEGFELLKDIDSNEHPEILLFKTLGLISQWNYTECIPLMEKYITSKKISNYQKIVGSYNLATAYVFVGKESYSRKILKQLIKETSEQKLSLLLASSYELFAQLEFNIKNYKEAKEHLKNSEMAFKSPMSLYAFFAKKMECNH